MKIPPHNIELEIAVLGTVMLNDKAVEIMIEHCDVDCFYREAHKKIYLSMLELYKESMEIHRLSVTDILKRKNILDEVGGMAYVAELEDVIPTISLMKQNILLLRDYSLKRKIISSSFEAIESCYGNNGTGGEIVAGLEKDLFSFSVQNSTGFTRISEEIEGTFKTIEENEKNKGSVNGIQTGFADFDRMTAGLQKSDMIVIAGRPGSGKSSLAVNIMQNIEKNGIRSAMFSLEMSRHQLTMRLLSSESNVSLQALRTGEIPERGWEKITRACGRLSKVGIWVDPSTDITPSVMRARARQLVKKEGVGLIVVDYMQLMSSSEKDKNREREISEISRTCKLMAKELDIPVVALSQLNRAVENRADKRPQLSDLRESGSLEQDADMVVMIYRDELYNDSESNPKKGIAELIIRKQRMGPTGTVELVFQEQFSTFRNRARC